MGARIGIQLCVSSASVYLIASNRTHDKVGKRRDQFLIGYSVILLILVTFAFFTNVLMGHLMWIEHRDFPGGPFYYYLSQGCSWVVVLGSSTDIAGNFMGDALLVGAGVPPDAADYRPNLNAFCVRQIYRCYIVWDSVWVALPLVLIFLASTGGEFNVFLKR